MDLVVSTKELANFFDVSIRAVQKWGQSGCPRIARGRWNLKAVFGWWWSNIALEKAADCDTSLTEARRLYWHAKADRERLRADTERGELVSKDKIEFQWTLRVAEVKGALYNLLSRLPPILEGKNQEEMRGLIESEVRLICETYSREGELCPSPKI